ncbi:hypothetical protein C8R45DRAFT_1224207 [Mycena sanguinolenta]|nr:hypothetical protein C8R45DRAFT_1224207 [Mycena sanguinolenta]
MNSKEQKRTTNLCVILGSVFIAAPSTRHSPIETYSNHHTYRADSSVLKGAVDASVVLSFIFLLPRFPSRTSPPRLSSLCTPRAAAPPRRTRTKGVRANALHFAIYTYTVWYDVIDAWVPQAMNWSLQVHFRLIFFYSRGAYLRRDTSAEKYAARHRVAVALVLLLDIFCAFWIYTLSRAPFRPRSSRSLFTCPHLSSATVLIPTTYSRRRQDKCQL